MPLEEESSSVKEPSGQILETTFIPEAVGYPITAPLLLGAISTGTRTRTPQQQNGRNGQTVVFTIRHPNEIQKKPLQAMIALTDNTRAAIFDAVNSYLDSKSALKVGQGQRKLKIICGVGKDGDVDLSALEETMWPDYFQYFRQYTRLPELTVDVVDC